MNSCHLNCCLPFRNSLDFLTKYLLCFYHIPIAVQVHHLKSILCHYCSFLRSLSNLSISHYYRVLHCCQLDIIIITIVHFKILLNFKLDLYFQINHYLAVLLQINLRIIKEDLHQISLQLIKYL